VSDNKFNDLNLSFEIKKVSLISQTLQDKFKKELSQIDSGIINYYFQSNNNNSINYVLFANGYEIGYSSLNQENSYWNLYEIYISEEFRELGLGTKLFQFILKECNKNNKAIRTYTLPSDRKAKNFYESNRITARVLIMEEKRANSRYRP
tara:strand:- start:711 stop:1160 length:450 start_codon:yes stop_codon:yes gene_type:complete